MDPITPESPEPANAEEDASAAWGVTSPQFERWPALAATLVSLGLYVTLPVHLYFGPIWLLPALEGALFVALLAARRVQDASTAWERAIAIGLIAVLNLANIGSLALLIQSLVSSTAIHGYRITPTHLMLWSAQIWLTNVLVFALWYWELDRGGPIARSLPHHRAPDFLFPQMANPGAAPRDWSPTFFDYLYTSFTNAAAFSPTDTMPLTPWAKLLFMIQSAASIVTAVLVIARIANILP